MRCWYIAALCRVRLSELNTKDSSSKMLKVILTIVSGGSSCTTRFPCHSTSRH